MSSSGKRKPTAPITNPYAKKRKDPPSSSHALSQSTAGLDAIGAGGAAATFSQAFENIEYSSHYRNQMKSVPTNPREEQARVEQRAIDLLEAQNQAVSDRDHHVLLQPHVLYVSVKQRGNGVLKYIRNVPFAFTKMVPDYIMSATSCALFLSIKYHQLYPAYIHRRLGELKTDFKLRVLLVLVDVEDNKNVLLQLNKLAVTSNLSLILAWTEQEAARYLETYKALAGKDASSIQKREQTNLIDQVADFFTAAKPVNKTDASNLLGHFSTVRAVLSASQDELALCEGLGNIKVQKLYDALHKPFSKHASAKRKQHQLEQANEKGEGAASSDAKEELENAKGN